jgi:AAA+ ATPase superfamily predicted ATPase
MEKQRLNDLNFLNRYYESGLSNILVVYGHRNIEHNELLNKFLENKRNEYFFARSASTKEQRFLWGRELRDKGIMVSQYPEYSEIFDACLASAGKNPFVFVIRNFEKIVKTSDEFFRELSEFVTKNGKLRQILVVLVSHDINWVENVMIGSLGKLAGEIAGTRKIKPLSFYELKNNFPEMSFTDAVMTYSVLGGQTGLWKYFKGSLSFKENICKNLINEGAFLSGEAIRLTEYHLRETSVYHTLLLEMARGVNKLNDLYHTTGFSRAKISVYIKTLIHHDFAYKAYSFGSAGRENVVKGVYKISDPMVNFYFKFLFPNASSLLQMSTDKFYDIFISAGMQEYVSDCFKSVCREYLFRCEERGLFPFAIEEEGQWLGKDGNIDFIAQSEMGDTALGMCFWNRQATHADLEKLYSCAKKAKLEGDVIYLFSTEGFDAWLMDAAMKSSGRLKLIGIDELTNG